MRSTQFRSSKGWLRAAAARMLIATAAVGLIAGCGGDDNVRSTSDTGGDNNQVSDLVGTVFGAVQSTNGENLAGATVSVGDRSVTTGDNGTFEIPDVPVTNTVSNNTGGTTGQFIPVTVVPPEGGDVTYAGATVTVNPEAQFFNETPPVSAPTNGPTSFADGYSASTGVIRLPALTTRVFGQLRSTATGNGIPNEPLSLDFGDISIDNGGNTGGVGGGGNSIAVSYSVPLITTNTDDQGNFEFMMVPDDSCFLLNSTNFALGAPSGNNGSLAGCDQPTDGAGIANGQPISTTSESNQSVNLGQVNGTAIVNADNVGPYVTFVSDVPVLNTGINVGNNGNRGILSNGVDGTGGITIRFSEPVAVNLNDSDLIVATGNQPNLTPVSATLTVASPTEIVVTTDSAIAPGTNVTIGIRTQSLLDTSGNPPQDNSPGANSPGPQEPTFDNAGVQFGGASQLAIFLQTFQPINQNADAVMLEQRNEQVDTGEPSDQFPFLTTSTLVDTVIEGDLNDAGDSTGNTVPASGPGELDDGEIQNLNEPNFDDPLEDFLTDGIFQQLFGGGFGNTHGDVARVTVTLPMDNVPQDLLMSVQRNSSLLDVLIFPVQNPNGSAVNNGRLRATAPDTNRFIIDPNGLTTFDVVIIGRAGERLMPGDTLQVTSRASAGLIGAQASLPLTDNAAPTVTPQLLFEEIDPTLAATTGTGGGVVTSGSGDRHLFVFPVSPQALDNIDPDDGFDDDTLQDELGSTNFDEEAARNARTATNVNEDESVFHDATSTAAFVASPMRKLGISVSEPLAAPPLLATPAYNGAAGLDNFTSQNDVMIEQAFGAFDSNHLVIFDVDNVLTLEADGRNTADPAIIDLTDTIQDSNGVVAGMDANARTLVRDFKPPVMTFAFYDGQQVVFRFDEPVRLQGQIEFLDCGVGTTINLANAATDPTDPAVLSMGNTQITIPTDNPAVPNVSGCFGDPDLEYAEDAYSAANLAGLTNLPMGAIDDTPGHGAVVYDTVPDRAAGTVFGQAFPDNTWDEWADNGLGTDAPIFAMADVIGPFSPVASTFSPTFTAGFTDAAAFDIVVDFTFNQPFFVTDGPGGQTDAQGHDADTLGNNDGVLDPADVLAFAQAKFSYFVGGAPVQMPDEARIFDSNGNNVVTVAGDPEDAVRIELTFFAAGGATVAATDTIGFTAGSSLSALFDPTNMTTVRPFDEGDAPSAANGMNDVNELTQIPAGGYTCPQVTIPQMGPAPFDEC